MEVLDVSREKPPFSNDICETCLRDNDLIDITNELHKETPFVILLERYISPEFYPTPKSMCKSCMHGFIKFNDFIENCKRNILLYETYKSEAQEIIQYNIEDKQNNLDEFITETILPEIHTQEIIDIDSISTETNNIKKETNTLKCDSGKANGSAIKREINETKSDKNNLEDNEEALLKEILKSNIAQEINIKEKTEIVGEVLLNQSSNLNRGNRTYPKYSSNSGDLSTAFGKINLKPLEYATKRKTVNNFNRNRKFASNTKTNKNHSTGNSEGRKSHFKQSTGNNTSSVEVNVKRLEVSKENKNDSCCENKCKEGKSTNINKVTSNATFDISEDIPLNEDEPKLENELFDVVGNNESNKKTKYKVNKQKYEKPQRNILFGKQKRISSQTDLVNDFEGHDKVRNVANEEKPVTKESRTNSKASTFSSSKEGANSSKFVIFKQMSNNKLSCNIASSDENNMSSSECASFKEVDDHKNSSSSLPTTNVKGNQVLYTTKFKGNNLNAPTLPSFNGRCNKTNIAYKENISIRSSKLKEISRNNVAPTRKINNKSAVAISNNSTINLSQLTESTDEFAIVESAKKTQDWLIQSVHGDDFTSEHFQRTSSSSFSNEGERKRVASTSTYRSEDVDDLDGMSVTKSEVNFENYRSGYEYKCDYCPCSFMLVSSLAHHKKVHGLTLISKPYLCEYCGETFMNFSKFRTHRKDHTLEQHYICLYCEKVVRGANIYNNHIRYHTVEMGEFSSTDKFDIIGKLILRGKFACGFCGKLFGNRNLLQTHLFWHPDEAKMFGCNYCDKTFTQKRSLRNHELLHKEEKKIVSAAKGKPNTC